MTKEERIIELETCLHDTSHVLGELMRSMLAHPDCTEGSEFDDFTSGAQKQINKVKLILDPYRERKVVIDPYCLPKDGQWIYFEDLSGENRIGKFSKGDDLFLISSSVWCTINNVISWIPLKFTWNSEIANKDASIEVQILMGKDQFGNNFIKQIESGEIFKGDIQ